MAGVRINLQHLQLVRKIQTSKVQSGKRRGFQGLSSSGGAVDNCWGREAHFSLKVWP